MILGCNTVFCHITRQSYELDTTDFHCSLKFKYRLWPWSLSFRPDFFSGHIVLSGNYLCQYIYKSHHAWQSYGLDTYRFRWSLCTKCLTVTLTFDLAICFLFATYPLVMIIIYAKLSIPACMTKKWVNTNRFYWNLCKKFKSWLWPWPLT